jgi:cytochrome c-type biogenesis protein CcmF
MVERGVRHRPRAWWGMLVAHLGIAVFAFGVTMVKTYDLERDVKMGPGDSTELNGYVFRMTGLKDVRGPNYEAVQATIAVETGGRTLVTLHPEKRVYRVQRNPMTESAVHSNGWRDLYVSMGEMLPTGEWIVRVQHKPFVSWIWGGCLVMMAGGLLAMSDRRYRSRKTVVADLPATTAGAAA